MKRVSPLSILASTENSVHHFLEVPTCQSTMHSTAHSHVAPNHNWRQEMFIHWLYNETDSHTMYVILHSQKVPLPKKFHECWMMTCMHPECVSFSHIMTDHFNYTSVMFSQTQMSILAFLQWSDKTSIPKTTYKMSVCTLCISKSRPFCCHCSCYLSYYVSQISVLHALLPWSLNAEHPMYQMITAIQSHITMNMSNSKREMTL